MKFRININPIASARARCKCVHGAPRLWTLPKQILWKRRFAISVRRFRKKTFSSAIQVDLKFVFKRPKKFFRKSDPNGLIPKTSKPDLDNLEKIVLDALDQDDWFTDDAIIVSLSSSKFYCERGGEPRIEVSIRPFDIFQNHQTKHTKMRQNP